MTQTLSIFSDFTNGFLKNAASKDLGLLLNQNAIQQALRNLILTDKYERLLDPHVGGNVNALLFEPLDGRTTVALQSAIRETIENFEPRVQLIDVICAPDPTHNAYSVTIKYSLLMSQSIQTLSFPLFRAR